MAGHYRPGRRSQVNDRYHVPNYSQFKSAAQIEAHGAELSSHMAALAANTELTRAKEATQDHHARKAVIEVVEIEPQMRARADARTRPNRVAKAPWKRSRKLKVRSHNRLKKSKKKKK